MAGKAVELIASSDSFKSLFVFAKPAKMKKRRGYYHMYSLASDWLKPKLINSKN